MIKKDKDGAPIFPDKIIAFKGKKITYKSDGKNGIGRPRNVESPEMLLEWWDEYKDGVGTITVQVAHIKGVSTMEVAAPLTMEGFKAFCHRKKNSNINGYLTNNNGSYTNFLNILSHIKDEIFEHNFSRASVGVYKENLISRQLNIKEQTETHSTIEVKQVTGIEIKSSTDETEI
jgi:hypothetical protein